MSREELIKVEPIVFCQKRDVPLYYLKFPPLFVTAFSFQFRRSARIAHWDKIEFPKIFQRSENFRLNFFSEVNKIRV